MTFSALNNSKNDMPAAHVLCAVDEYVHAVNRDWTDHKYTEKP